MGGPRISRACPPNRDGFAALIPSYELETADDLERIVDLIKRRASNTRYGFWPAANIENHTPPTTCAWS